MFVGESKLCQIWSPLIELRRTRLPLSWSCSCMKDGDDDEGGDLVPALVHTIALTASTRTRVPVSERDSVVYRPLTGWSRFAIQTTVERSVNHMAKQ